MDLASPLPRTPPSTLWSPGSPREPRRLAPEAASLLERRISCLDGEKGGTIFWGEKNMAKWWKPIGNYRKMMKAMICLKLVYHSVSQLDCGIVPIKIYKTKCYLEGIPNSQMEPCLKTAQAFTVFNPEPALCFKKGATDTPVHDWFMATKQ